MSGEAKDFLVDVVMAEVSRMDNENLVFRGNTFATKAVDTYMKMVGEKVGLHVHVCVAVGWQGVGHPRGGRGWGIPWVAGVGHPMGGRGWGIPWVGVGRHWGHRQCRVVPQCWLAAPVWGGGWHQVMWCCVSCCTLGRPCSEVRVCTHPIGFVCLKLSGAGWTGGQKGKGLS